MVTKRILKRKDTAVRVSRWIDKEVEKYIAGKLQKINYPSKRNFVDHAVLQLLEEKGVKINK